MKRFFKRVFWIIFVGFLVFCAIITRRIDGVLAILSVFLPLYAMLKIMLWAHRRGLYDTTTTPEYRRYTTTYSNTRNSAYDRQSVQKANDQAVWERTKAQNDAIYQQYQANKNAGTYAGYQAQNRANAARNRANRY